MLHQGQARPITKHSNSAPYRGTDFVRFRDQNLPVLVETL